MKLVVSDDLPGAVAAAVAAAASQAIAERGAFFIAIAGGSLVKMLGAMANLPGIEWAKWHVAWVDERCVPLADPESNYGGALAAWLSKVPIPAEQVHTIEDRAAGGGLAAAALHADEYEAKLKAASSLPRAAGMPIFDLLLLGFGPDGHICSLFPGHDLLGDTSGRWILPIGDSPKPPPERITLSLAAVNAARAVALVGSGGAKGVPVLHAFERALGIVKEGEAPLPCALARGAGTAPPPLWLLDEAAASPLTADHRASFGAPAGGHASFDFGLHFGAAPSAKRPKIGITAKLANLPDEPSARAEAGVLWEDDLWLVMHKRPPCGVVGHLMLMSKRHVQGPSTFSDAEAAAVGVALRRCEAALEEVTGCDRVYTAALGSPKSGSHFHAHMMPIFDAAPPAAVTGTPFDVFLQEKRAAEGVEGAAADPAECARVAAAFRERMAREGK